MQEEADETEDVVGEGNIVSDETARESLASLGLSPEEGQQVPDYDGTIKIFNEGDIVNGTVVKVDKDEVLLDIGYKSEGVIPARELSIRYDVKPSEIISEGEKIEALVLQKEDKEGRLILSKKRAQYERAWCNIERVKAQDGIVEGEVIEVVKGGLILDIGLRGFLPASLVEMRRVKDLSQFLGQKLEAKIIELDKNRNNVVLSRRAFLEKLKSSERKEFLDKLEKGSRMSGSVSSIVNFGAFVDLGGVDGLIHISELSWSHVDHPSEVLSVGDEVQVEILDIDLERERVSLSMKKAQEDPWEKLSKESPAGSTVQGKVTKLVPFGAFVELAPGVEGLVHISELAWDHIEFPEEVVSVDDEVEAKIIDIDLDRRRISLSIKQLTGPGEVEYEEREEGEISEPQLVETQEFEAQLNDSEVSEVAEEITTTAEIASEAAEIAAEVKRIEAEVTSTQFKPEEAEPEAGEDEAKGSSPPEIEVEEEVPPAEIEVEEMAPSAEAEEGEEVPVEEEKAEEVPPVPPVEEEEAPVEEQAEPAGEPGSLESILADMKRKGQKT